MNNNSKDLQLNSLIQDMAQRHQPELPSPSVIWWRAQIQKKFAEQHRIERPLVIMRMLAGAVGLIVAAYFVMNYRGQFGSGILPGVLLLCLFTFVSLGLYIIANLREAKS